MRDDEHKGTMHDDDEHKGLTKPLVNNVGGMIDQDAPSADQLLEGQPEATLDKVGKATDGRVDRAARTPDSTIQRPLVTPADPRQVRDPGD